MAHTAGIINWVHVDIKGKCVELHLQEDTQNQLQDTVWSLFMFIWGKLLKKYFTLCKKLMVWKACMLLGSNGIKHLPKAGNPWQMSTEQDDHLPKQRFCECSCNDGLRKPTHNWSWTSQYFMTPRLLMSGIIMENSQFSDPLKTGKNQ